MCNNVRPHAIGVELNTHVQVDQVPDEPLKTGFDSCFSAGNDNTVNPLLTSLQVLCDFRARNTGKFCTVPGEVPVVAGGTMHIAATKKNNAAAHAGPVAQAYSFESVNIIPGCWHVRITPA